MGYIQKKLLLFFSASFIGCVFGYLTLQLDLPINTTGDMLVKLGKGFFYGLGSLSLVFFILLFLPQAFPAWKKFAVWFIPLATLLFIFYPEPGSGDLFSPYPEQVFRWVSIIYVLISIVVIGVALLRNREKT